MVTIWWDRISTICNFNHCHFGAGNDWRGRFIRRLTLWTAFTQVSRWMGKCAWKSHWLDWEKELKSAHEPSVHMAKDFPSWATRGRGIRNWMKSTKQWGIGGPPSPSIEKCVARKQKERENTSCKIQMGFWQPPSHCQTWSNLFPLSRAKSFLTYKTRIRKLIRLPWGINEVIINISSNTKGCANA